MTRLDKQMYALLILLAVLVIVGPIAMWIFLAP